MRSFSFSSSGPGGFQQQQQGMGGGIPGGFQGMGGGIPGGFFGAPGFSNFGGMQGMNGFGSSGGAAFGRKEPPVVRDISLTLVRSASLPLLPHRKN